MAGNWVSDWKQLHPLSDRAASLGIRGFQLRAPLKPSTQYDSVVVVLGVSGGPLIVPNDVKIGNYAYDRCSFFQFFSLYWVGPSGMCVLALLESCSNRIPREYFMCNS